MRYIVAVFEDGVERPLCLAPNGVVQQGGVTVGIANDPDCPHAGGRGELYGWGAFTLADSRDCAVCCHGCVDCKAG